MIEIYLLAIMIMPSCYSKSTECIQENISCPDIKITDGFKFTFAIPGGRDISEISVYHNKTSIAHAKPREQKFDHLPEVLSMDNSSVVTTDCRDLRVWLIFSEGPYISDYCVDFNTEKRNTSDPEYLPTQSGLKTGVAVAVLSVLIVVLLWYLRKKQNRVASLHFFRHLLSCCFHRGGISQAERGERGENGLSETPSDTDQLGSGGNDVDEDKLETVCVQSNDSTANGRTPQTLSMDHNLNDVGIKLTKNGDLTAPDVNRALNHRAMNRNIRDDPGGVNDTRGQFIVWSSERQGSQDHVNEGQLLLWNQRAAVQDFDMTAVALVNKHGFDPDQVSRCSTVPETDVESMSANMKTHSIH